MRGVSIFLIAALSLLAVCLISQSRSETVYFVVGEIEPYHNDSYVLPLTDANDIAHARDLIKYGPAIGQAIVVAEIDCGMDGVNRNYLSPIKLLWNWHVTDFNYFTDATIEIWDGYPGAVQYDCQWWMGNTGGYIGFWSYTVVAELGTDPNHWKRDFDSDSNVNGIDFAWLSSYWLNEDCNAPSWCGGSDLDKSSSVDYNDLRIFGQSWLSPFAARPVWFDAWNNPRQCHGDADGSFTGKDHDGQRKWVNNSDLTILQASMGSKYPDDYGGGGNYIPEADFDHDGDVDDDDNDILMIWLDQLDVPADCQTQ